MTNKFRKEKYITQLQSQRTGKWCFRVRVNGHDERFNEEDYLSASMAFKKAVEYRNQVLANPQIESLKKTKTTIEEIWEEAKILYPRADETDRKNDGSFNRYVSHKKTPISKIQVEDIQQDLNNMIYKCSDDTISRVRTIWNRIYKTAIRKKYISANLVELVESPKSKKVKPKPRNEYIKFEDMNTLGDYLEDNLKSSYERKFAKKILNVLYYTGLRPSELFALEKDDIDLKKQTICINKRIDSSREIQRLNSTKTDESFRTIPFTSKIKPYFEDLLKNDSEILFPKEDGSHYLPSALSETYHNQAQKINIDFHMYQCRHTYITNMYRKGVDIKTIQDLVGQKIDATTLGYVVSSEERMKNAIDLI